MDLLRGSQRPLGVCRSFFENHCSRQREDVFATWTFGTHFKLMFKMEILICHMLWTFSWSSPPQLITKIIHSVAQPKDIGDSSLILLFLPSTSTSSQVVSNISKIYPKFACPIPHPLITPYSSHYLTINHLLAGFPVPLLVIPSSTHSLPAASALCKTQIRFLSLPLTSHCA